MNEIPQQSVIHAVHLLQKPVRSLKQEPAQRLRTGEALQTGQVLEAAVGT